MGVGLVVGLACMALRCPHFTALELGRDRPPPEPSQLRVRVAAFIRPASNYCYFSTRPAPVPLSIHMSQTWGRLSLAATPSGDDGLSVHCIQPGHVHMNKYNLAFLHKIPPRIVLTPWSPPLSIIPTSAPAEGGLYPYMVQRRQVMAANSTRRVPVSESGACTRGCFLAANRLG
jgi:hypothetical protein